MKRPLFLWMIAIAGMAAAGQQAAAMEEGQKARPAPIRAHTMLIPDMPAAPPQTTPAVMIAQTNQAQDSTKVAERVLGVCKVIDNEERKDKNGEIRLNRTDSYTVSAAATYLVDYEHRSDITQEDELAAKTTVLSQPKHGTLKEDSALNGSYFYFPDTGYVGKDSAEVLVEIKGVKVKVRYFIHVLEYGEKDAYDANCTDAPTNPWKIS